MKPLLKKFLPTLLLALAPFVLSAHPGAGIVVDSEGQVCFTCGGCLVRVDATGAARIILQDAQHVKFYQLHHIFMDAQRNLYTAADTGSGIWKVSHDDKLSRFFPPPNEDRSVLIGLGGDPFCMDREGNIFAVNSRQDKFTQLLKITAAGRITLIAGGDWGHADGKAGQAQFGDLHGGAMALASDGSLYLTDDYRYVRKITIDGTVSTLAGGPERGFADGSRTQAHFDGACGLALDGDGNIYVADTGNNRLRKITPQGITTFAGTGGSGSADGLAAGATFDQPSGVTFGPGGVLYVLEGGNSRVRKITPDGQVTTLLRSIADLK